MFNADLIKAAKAKIDTIQKAYVTSDNSLYIIPRDADLITLLTHCANNSLTLLDVEENKEIELELKKKSKSK